MWYIPKIDDYLKILTDEEVKDFIATNFSEYFKFIREEQNIKKIPNLLSIFPTAPDEEENMCNQILLKIVYIPIMLRFRIFLVQKYKRLALNQWLE